jgi:hypothetical protein
MSWVRWFWQDFDGATKLFTCAETGQYLRLLHLQLDSGKQQVIPGDTAILTRVLGEEPAPKVLAKFAAVPQGLQNTRLANEMALARHEYDGKKAGGKRVDTAPKPEPEPEPEPEPRTDCPAVGRVFAFWQQELEHPTAKLTTGRRKKVRARLKEGYDEEAIIKAIRGCAKSRFHRGENEQHRRYDDLTLICRSGEKVEQFAAMADQKNPVEEWLEEP